MGEMKWEIKIMQDRIIEFNQKKLKVDEKIEEFLKGNEDSREEITLSVQKMDTKAREEYENTRIRKYENTREEYPKYLKELC